MTTRDPKNEPRNGRLDSPAGTDVTSPADGSDPIAALLAEAGPRDSVELDGSDSGRRFEQAKAAARASWRDHLAEENEDSEIGAAIQHPASRSGWRPGSLAAAAVLLLAVTAGWWLLSGERQRALDESVVRLGTVEAVAGSVRIGETEGTLGSEVLSGAWIETGDRESGAGRVGLRLGAGQSVRFDAGSRARFLSAERIQLESGAVYVDSGVETSRANPGSAITVTTPWGSVREIGTQFEVRLQEDAEAVLGVRVREGAVVVEAGASEQGAAAGEAVQMSAGGAWSRSQVSSDDSSWTWIEALAIPFSIEGRTLSEYLRWLERETGWTVRFQDPQARAELEGTILHGSIEGMAPRESVTPILVGSGLEARFEDGGLLVLVDESID